LWIAFQVTILYEGSAGRATLGQNRFYYFGGVDMEAKAEVSLFSKQWAVKWLLPKRKSVDIQSGKACASS
jgi:hypothetical protein